MRTEKSPTQLPPMSESLGVSVEQRPERDPTGVVGSREIATEPEPAEIGADFECWYYGGGLA